MAFEIGADGIYQNGEKISREIRWMADPFTAAEVRALADYWRPTHDHEPDGCNFCRMVTAMDAFAARLEEDEQPRMYVSQLQDPAKWVSAEGAFAEALREEGRREVYVEIAERQPVNIVDRSEMMGRTFECAFCGLQYSTHRPDSPELDAELAQHHDHDCLWLKAQQLRYEAVRST